MSTKIDMNVIGKRLVNLRGDRTQKEVSEAMGVKLSTYAMYETGKRVPSDENKIRIANFYKKSVQFIFFRE